MCLKTLSPVPRIYLLKQFARKYGIDAISKVSERKDLEWVLLPEAREKQVNINYNTWYKENLSLEVKLQKSFEMNIGY